MALSATFTADFKSFTDACAKAQVSLKGIETGAGNVEGKLDRMANSLTGTKVIQQASLIAEAIERVGGVSTLTEKELAKIGPTATEAAAKLVALGEKVPPGIQKIADAAKAAAEKTSTLAASAEKNSGLWAQLKENFSGLGGEIQRTAIGMATGLITVDALKSGFEHLGEFVKSSVEAYLDAERVQRQLTAALQAQGTAIPSVIGLYDDLANEFSQTTVNSSGAVKGIEQLLVTVGNVMPSEMHKAIQAAADLSSGLGIDLKTAALTVAKASEENTSALRKAGVQLDDTRVKGEGLEYVLGQVEKRFGGQAQAEIESYGGQIKRLGNQWDDFKEHLGGVVVKTGALQVALALASAEILKTQAILAKLGLGDKPVVKTAADIARDKQATADAEAAARKQAEADKAATEAAKVHAEALKKLQEAQRQYNEEVQKGVAKYSGAKEAADVKFLADVIKRLGDVSLLSAIGQRQLAKDLYDLQQRGGQLQVEMLDVVATYLRFADGGVKVEAGIQNLTKSLPNLLVQWQAQEKAAADAEAAYDKLLASRTFVTAGQIRNLPQITLKKEDVDNRGIESALKGSLGKAAEEFPKMLANAIIHGQSIVQAFQAIFIQIAGDFGELFGKSLAKEGSKLSKFFGDLFGPLASIGADLLEKVFGKVLKTEGKQVNDLRDKWMDAAGGLATIQKQIADSGNDPRLVAAFEKLYHTGKIKDFQQAQEDFKKAFDAVMADFRSQTDQSGVLWSERTKQMIKDADAFGLSVKDVQDILGRQQDKLVSGANGLTTALGAQADKYKDVRQAVDDAAKARLDALKSGAADDTDAGTAAQRSRFAELDKALTDANAKMRDLTKSSSLAMYADLKKAAEDAARERLDALKSGLADDTDAGTAAQRALFQQLDQALTNANAKFAKVEQSARVEFDRLTRIELGAFNTLVSSGVDAVTAMDDVGAGIDNLIKAADTFGLSGNAAFDELKRWRDLTTENAPLLEQVGALNDLLVASANLGGLTADSFADLEAQGVSAYEQLTAAGLTQQEAETAMKPLLESIIKLHEERGLAIDAETQKLIDQAQKDGVLKGEQISTNDILMQGLGKVIELLGGKLPDAWVKFANAGKKAADDINNTFENFDIHIPVKYDFADLPSIPGQDTSGVPALARGGIVRKPTVALVGESGPEAIIPLSRMAPTSITVNVDATNAVLPDRQSLSIFADRLVPHLTGAILRQVNR